jgi:hypothetical protein
VSDPTALIEAARLLLDVADPSDRGGAGDAVG